MRDSHSTLDGVTIDIGAVDISHDDIAEQLVRTGLDDGHSKTLEVAPPAAMLRPGRLDAVISVEPPDAEAVERLLRIYGRKLIDPRLGLRFAGTA